MGKGNPISQGIMAAGGTKTERELIKKEVQEEAKKLADKMPRNEVDRAMYVRAIVERKLKGEIEFDVFSLFVKMTKSYQEVLAVEPRVRLVLSKQKGQQK